MRTLLIGHAPPWVAFFLWLIVTAAAAVLWRAILRHTERERRREHRARRQLGRLLNEQDDRITAIEDHLFPREPPEDKPHE